MGCAGGDGAILLAAFFYSLMTLRLSTHARRYRPIQLAAAKCTGLAIIALGVMQLLLLCFDNLDVSFLPEVPTSW